jgi:hypothetical protein
VAAALRRQLAELHSGGANGGGRVDAAGMAHMGAVLARESETEVAEGRGDEEVTAETRNGKADEEPSEGDRGGGDDGDGDDGGPLHYLSIGHLSKQ